MEIKTFVVNALSVNCYVVSDETKEAVIIDAGCSDEYEWSDIKKYIATEELQVKHLLNTHLHFDHVWGNSYIYKDLGLRPEANYEDLHIYENMDEHILSVVGIGIPHPPIPPLGTSLLDGSEVHFGNTTLKVITTPGHSRGSICFYSEKDHVLFSGDTLFCGSCGRTDLEGGSYTDIMQSLLKLSALPNETKVLCGHGPSTTIGREKLYNPYMRGF
ncbi:MAG: MBL fold metallo-hydrolase [Bacteroidaceae bacterium]|nr:MBL fold metallo-hydrolase [Bacteroidaceae bacterium]